MVKHYGIIDINSMTFCEVALKPYVLLKHYMNQFYLTSQRLFSYMFYVDRVHTDLRISGKHRPASFE